MVIIRRIVTYKIFINKQLQHTIKCYNKAGTVTVATCPSVPLTASSGSSRSMRGRATRPLIARTGDHGVLGPLSGAPLRSVSDANERYVNMLLVVGAD